MKKNTFLLILTVILLTSCAQRTPFTQSIREQNRLTNQELQSIQFYTSADIVLQRGEKSQTGKDTQEGELILTSGSSVDQIIIKAGTPGAVKKVLGINKITVAFEIGEGKVLVFGDSSGRKGPYTLLAAEWINNKGKLQYGGKTYYTVRGSSQVQLLFKMRRLNRFKKNQHIAKGVKVN